MKYAAAIATLVATAVAAAHAAKDGAKGPNRSRRLKKGKTGKAKSDKDRGPCNGRGTVFAEESQVLDAYGFAPACSCFGCYSGDYCQYEEDIATCKLLVSDAELPLTTEGILEPRQITFSNTYRVVYQSWRIIPTPAETVNNNNNHILYAMYETLIKLHAAVGNAKTDGYQLVVGLGAHQLLQAANFAHAKLIQDKKGDPSAVTTIYSEDGYWSKMPRMAKAFAPSQAWADKGGAMAAETDESLVQLVVSPSNPLNLLAEDQDPLIAAKERQVWDLVYYWPSCFTDKARITPIEKDIMIFSSSKLAGYAGHRFGWAWVKEDAVATQMAEFISVTTQAYPAAEMLYNTVILEDILASIGTDNDFFVEVQKELMSRCLEMEAVFEATGGRFTNLTPCGNMYLQVECSEGECMQYFDAINLVVTPGPDDGLPANTARIAFGYERAWFDKIVQKLELL